MITIVYRCHETSNFSFLAYYPVISLLLKQQVKFKCPVSCPVRSVKKSQQLQKSPLHSRTRLRAIACIGGGPFGVVNFASHFICAGHHHQGGQAALQEEKNWDTSLFFRPTRIANEEEKRLILSLCIKQGLVTALDSRRAHVHLAQGMEALKPG